MKIKVTQALYRNDIATVFHMLKDPSNHLVIHDAMMEQLTPIQAYFYIKAFRLTGSPLYYQFASISASSKYGPKALFHRVLSIYEVPPYNFQYCHSEANGKQPELTKYANIARSILV